MVFAPHARVVPTGCPASDSATVEKGNRLACWLWSKGHNDVDYIPFAYRGTDEVVRRFVALLDYVERVCSLEGCPCTVELVAVHGVTACDYTAADAAQSEDRWEGCQGPDGRSEGGVAPDR